MSHNRLSSVPSAMNATIIDGTYMIHCLLVADHSSFRGGDPVVRRRLLALAGS